jgi:hypothetical protein
MKTGLYIMCIPLLSFDSIRPAAAAAAEAADAINYLLINVLAHLLV